MATPPPSRPLLLSFALHGALLLVLMAAGIGPPPHEDARQVVHVVWIESGLPSVAARGDGDRGQSIPDEADPAAEPLADHAPVETARNDDPAPETFHAEDPVSAADRPAPASADAATDTPAPDTVDAAVHDATDADEAASPVPLVAEAARPDAPAAETADGDAADAVEAVAETPDAADAVEAVAETPDAADEHAELAADAEPPVDRTGRDDVELEPTPELAAELVPGADSEALEPPQPVREPPRSAEPFAQASSEPPRSAEPFAQASSEPPRSAEPFPQASSEPLAAEEHERVHNRVLDWINRSRDLASRPSLAWSRDGRAYRAQFTRVPAAGATGLEEALVEITTELDGRHVATTMRLKRLAFSHFAQLIDRWDPGVQIHDDVIDGRFHSNSEILIANSGGIQPVFHGLVTTAGGIDTTRSKQRVRRHDVFLGGLDTRAPRIALPRRFTPLDELIAEDATVVELAADTHITFAADGRYRARAMDGSHAPLSGRLSSTPTYLIAADKTTVRVDGTVNGKVLVYSPRRIVIAGNLVYAADPMRRAGSDDYLGLVSDGSIEIAAPEVTGPGDLTVHAAIYAKSRFAISRFSRGDRATLTIYGSVTAGSLTATEPRYRTRLVFDSRLEDARPPSFPMTDRYELASWDGVWRSAGSVDPQ